MSRPLVIYHAGCRDGWAAAFVAHAYYHGAADFFAAYYGQEPPPVTHGQRVFLLDFCYKRDVLVALAKRCDLAVLDHHKTAQADVDGLSRHLLEVVFDMDRSGAGIAWDYFYGGDKHDGFVLGRPIGDVLRPWWVNYVEDRDLWRWALPDSRLVNAYLGALPFTFDGWREGVSISLDQAKTMGRAIDQKVGQYVAEVSKNAAWGFVYDTTGASLFGEAVPIVNVPQCDVSEVLEFLMSEHDVDSAVAWWQRADGLFQYSLRSTERSRLDVSALAKRCGGGGHRQAAGFQTPQLVHARNGR